MQDMQALLEQYRAMMEPAGSGRDVSYERESHAKRYADDSHVFFPGNWFMAGHHRGRLEVDMMWRAVRLIWPEGTRLFRNHFFVGEDTIAIEWWSRNEVWNGVSAQNSGVGRLRFRGGQVIDHYEITDSEYFDEIHGDWRGFMDPEIGAHLPRYASADSYRNASPGDHEWALESCGSDGRNLAEPAGLANLRVVEGIWQSLPDLSLASFSEDVDVFFQGRLWPFAGHHPGRAGVERLLEVGRRLFARAERIQARYWAGEERVLVEWFAAGETWKGDAFREGGFSVFDFREGLVCAVRTYLDTLYQAELLEGWRERIGSPLGSDLPSWPEPGIPRYPQPETHE